MRRLARHFATILIALASVAPAAAQEAEPARISLTIGEDRHSLDDVTDGLVSDGEMLLALADVGAPDDSVAATAFGALALQAAAEPRSLAVSLSQFDYDFWVEPAPGGTLPAEPERDFAPEPEEDPCVIGLTCRDKG
jgi:hypothetical protein